MHTQEELDKAILELYKDYKDVLKDYEEGNLKFFYEMNKINNDERKYTKEEVYYIGFNALMMLKKDLDNNK